MPTPKTSVVITARLSLDKEDIEAAGGRSAEDVLLAASLSAKWENGDAIDRAMAASMGGDTKVSRRQPCAIRHESSALCAVAAGVGDIQRREMLCEQSQRPH